MGGQEAVGKEEGIIEGGRPTKECVKAKCFDKYCAGVCRARYNQAT